MHTCTVTVTVVVSTGNNDDAFVASCGTKLLASFIWDIVPLQIHRCRLSRCPYSLRWTESRMHETIDLCNITRGFARCSTQHGAWIALRGLTSMVGLELKRNRSLHEPTVQLPGCATTS